MKIKNFSKKLISMLMALMICLSAFPITSFASTFITDMNSDAQFGVISGTLDKYGHEMHYAKYDGKTYIVFCVQYGKTSPNGSTYEYGKDFKKYVNREGSTYEKIADYIAFGYTLQHGDGLPNTKQEWIDACCTQQFVWETLGVNPTRSSWNSTYMSDKLYKEWLSDTEDLIDLYYDKQISFNGTTKNINLGGSTTLVVFETLYRDGVEIAVHADIDDEGQTVKINVPVPEKPSTPKTGDDRNYSFWIGLGAIAIGGAISAVILKIKTKKDEGED